MIINKTTIPGCFEILPKVIKDKRGVFVKTFQRSLFEENRLETVWVEEYYSLSKRRVLRGLHFQVPPHDHAKLVYCVIGKVLDAVVDLRINSPMFGQHILFDISAEKANMIYIPRGLAHGFYTLSESAIMMYNVSTIYAPEHDTGILWNSAGIAWPDDRPVISKRDAGFPSLSDFTSPFLWRKVEK